MASWKYSRNEKKYPSEETLRDTNWYWEFFREFLYQLKFGIYMMVIALIYILIIRDAFPGRFREIFLVIAIFQGCDIDIKKYFSLISKILDGLSTP